MTLVELLVVITILLLFTAVAIPTMRPAMEGRQIREAARAVHVYLGRARNRAMRTGRPVGVLFERFETQPQICQVLRQVEVPPPYSGDIVDTLVSIQVTGPGPTFRATLVSGLATTVGIVRVGDLMRLNFQGPYYRILGPDQDQDGYVDAFPMVLQLETRAVQVPWTTQPSRAMAFQIIRQPAFASGGMPSAVAPLRLSRDAVIDLAWSGPDSFLPLGLEPAGQNDFRSPVLIFTPDGTAQAIYAWRPPNLLPGYAPYPLVEPVHFLIGRRDRTPPSPRTFQSGLEPFPSPDAEDGLYNFQDPGNLWVTVFPQTGLINVAEVNAGAQLDPQQLIAQLEHARRLARQSQVAKGER